MTRRKRGVKRGGTLELGDGRESNMEERRLSKRTVGRGPPRAAAAKGAHRLRGDARSAAEGGELRAQERGRLMKP